ncbi:MCE family protein, partial [Myxococcus sp. CA039A]|nr:MCE family protein [Myxococcus sp. CA039A]
GTLGGLISDPTVYEDLREVLGNVKRNRILRALVRFSLDNRKDLEQMGKVQRVEPKAEAPKRAEPPQPVAAPPPADAAPASVPEAE